MCTEGRDGRHGSALASQGSEREQTGCARSCRQWCNQNGVMTNAHAGSRIEMELTADGYVEAVSRRTVDGSTVWRIDPPDGGQDAFVAVELNPAQIVLTSWSGWRIRANLVTGSEADRSFTK